MEISKQKLWESRLTDWENSDMDICSWCRQNAVSEKQFHYWKRKLRTAPTASEPIFVEYTNELQTPTSKQSLNQPMLSIRGVKLYVPEQFNQETLLSLVRLVKRIFAIRESNFVGFLLLAHNRIATIVACQLESRNSN